jgi:catechol 2,3-dioxygenase-like lactoylglutathione lyase family enzyme
VSSTVAQDTAAAMPFSHVAIGVTDMARALPFYLALGFRVTVDHIERWEDAGDLMAGHGGGGDRHVVYMRSIDGPAVQFLALHHRAKVRNRPLELDQVGLDHLGFWTDDLDGRLADLVAAGGKVLIPPFEADGHGWTLGKGSIVRSVFVADPDGTPIQLDQAIRS